MWEILYLKAEMWSLYFNKITYINFAVVLISWAVKLFKTISTNHFFMLSCQQSCKIAYNRIFFLFVFYSKIIFTCIQTVLCMSCGYTIVMFRVIIVNKNYNEIIMYKNLDIDIKKFKHKKY